MKDMSRHLFCILSLFIGCVFHAQGRLKSAYRKVEFYGNEIRYSKYMVHRDYYLYDSRIPLDQDMRRLAHCDIPLPIRLNGEKIYTEVDYGPFFSNKSRSFTFSSFLLYSLQDELSKLEDGDYSIHLLDVVIDKKGKVAFYDTAYCGVWSSSGPLRQPTTRDLKREINDKLYSVLREIEFAPALRHGTEVNSCLLLPLFPRTIVVKDHKVSFY